MEGNIKLSLPSSQNMGSHISLPLLTLQNTMGTQNVVTDISSKQVSPSLPTHPCLFHIGPLPFPLPSTLSIACLHRPYTTNHPISNYSAICRTTQNCAASAVSATLGYVLTHLTNLTPGPLPVSSSDILSLRELTNPPHIDFTPPDMSDSLSPSFPLPHHKSLLPVPPRPLSLNGAP